MLTEAQLQAAATGKLASAQKLFQQGNYDDAVYLAGYAVEIQLKARIVAVAALPGFPEDRHEFRSMNLRELQTHELHELLVRSGQEDHIKQNYMAQWSICEKWSPDSRYAP